MNFNPLYCQTMNNLLFLLLFTFVAADANKYTHTYTCIKFYWHIYSFVETDSKLKSNKMKSASRIRLLEHWWCAHLLLFICTQMAENSINHQIIWTIKMQNYSWRYENCQWYTFSGNASIFIWSPSTHFVVHFIFAVLWVFYVSIVFVWRVVQLVSFHFISGHHECMHP